VQGHADCLPFKGCILTPKQRREWAKDFKLTTSHGQALLAKKRRAAEVGRTRIVTWDTSLLMSFAEREMIVAKFHPT
jgi:hypothetical protein